MQKIHHLDDEQLPHHLQWLWENGRKATMIVPFLMTTVFGRTHVLRWRVVDEPIGD